MTLSHPYYTAPSPGRVAVHIEGADFAVEALKQVEFAVRRRVLSAAVRAANAVVVREAKLLAPTGATGMLKKQIRGTVKFDPRGGLITGHVRSAATKKQRGKGIHNAARYAHLVIGGTKPHVIQRAEDGPALATPSGFYTRIQHPGSKPRPFMEQAADKCFREAVAHFESKLEERLNIEVQKIARQQTAAAALAAIGERF